MKFSEQWVREWVNPAISAEQLCEQITMLGLEVDGVEKVAGDFTGVVVGEVVECAQHPDADKLRVTKVNVGGDRLLDIVCGAPNCRQGLKVACAVEGAELPGDFKIKKTKLRGQPSEGMLCSFSELGIESDANGIIELPKDAPIGTNLRDYLKLDEKLISYLLGKDNFVNDDFEIIEKKEIENNINSKINSYNNSSINFSTKNNQNGESYRNVISDEKKEMEEKIDRIISSYRENVNNSKEVNVENAVNIAIEKSTEINKEKDEKKEAKKTKFVHKNSWYSVEEDDDSEEENNNQDVQEKELDKERDLEINNREIMEEKEVYLTKEGYEKLEEELKILKTEERDNIEERIKVAKSFGDLSENSEYDEARSAQAANENKILEIEQMLKKAKIIDEKDIDTTTVQIGNTVYITNIANNKEQKYTIVGTAEANVLQGKISNESPIAKSLLRSKSWRCSSSRSTCRDYRI